MKDEKREMTIEELEKQVSEMKEQYEDLNKKLKQKKQDEAAEVRKRRSCMDRPKIYYVPKGLYIGIVQPFGNGCWKRTRISSNCLPQENT